jgi:hypothetical protein
MAATATIRLLADVLGLGDDKKFSAFFPDTATPTIASGPVYVIPMITTAVAVERGGIGNINTRCVAIQCLTDSMWASPFSSANVTAMCFLSAGAFNLYTYTSGVTAIPWVVAMSSTAAYEVFSFGVAS